MATLLHGDRTLAEPQRVRQFVLRSDTHRVLKTGGHIPQLSVVGAPVEVAAGVGLLEGPSGSVSDDEESDEFPEQDLPAFLRRRSLSRRLNDAYDDCYRSPVGEWLGGLMQALFRR